MTIAGRARSRVGHRAPTPHQPRGPRRSGRAGQSLVEFALVIPIFMLLLGGMVDVGFMLYSRMTVISASREGARAAVNQLDNPTGIPIVVDGAVRGAASGLTSRDLSIVVECVPLQQARCDLVSGGQPDPVSGDAINVTLNYTYHSIFLTLLGTTVNLSGSTRMVLE